MKRRGYTLFELILVVALIALLAGLAVPPIEAMYSDYKLQAAVDQVSGQWSAIRARAITEGRPYRFAIQPGSGDFRAGPDAAEFWSGGDAPATNRADSNAPLVVQDSLPRGVRFAMMNSADSSAPGNTGAGDTGNSADAAPAGWSTVAVFLPDGTAQEDVEISFQFADSTPFDSRPIALRLRALTGGMSTRRIPANERQ